jgi:hypothetical protein
LLFSSLALSGSFLFADTIDEPSVVSQRDIEALRDWINTKRQVTIKEIGGALSISGAVHFEMQAINETAWDYTKGKSIRQRGDGAPNFLEKKIAPPQPIINWDVGVDLMLDYRTDRTWASIKLEFDNNAGIYSGSDDKIKLRRAFLGGRAIDWDTFNMDIELGRQGLSSFMASKLQFRSRFDGLLFRINKEYEFAGTLYANMGAFVIDERNNHYGYAGELGLLQIASTGLYAKYSLIDWNTKTSAPHGVATNQEVSQLNISENNRGIRFNFLISQLLLGYRFVPVSWDKMIEVYVAGLYNHAAKQRFITDNKRAPGGGYLGFSIGQLRKKGDWNFDANYQILQAQAVPDFDVSGIGLGNTADAGLYNTKIDGTGDAVNAPNKSAAVAAGIPVADRFFSRGNGNYRGFQLTLNYLITDAITFQQQWQQSISLDDSIGGFRRYKQYEIEFIYGF